MHGLIPLKVTNGIHSSSSRTPHKVAVRHGDRSVTYKQLTDNMRCVSQAAFTDIRFQGNVAIVGNNSIEYLEVLLGLADVGVPVVTINPKWVAREVIECLKDCKARVLFIDNDLYKEEYGQHCDLIIIFGSKYEEWVKYYKPIEHYPDFKDSAIFNIVYSSGTTNKPKGMLISHRSRSMTSYLMPIDWNCMKEYDVMLSIASFSNAGGNGTAIATLNNGGTVVIATGINPRTIMRTIEQEKVTCMLVVPSILRLILRDITSHRYDVSSLTSIVVGSTTFPPLLKGKAINFFGDIVYDLYASTECGPITLLRPSQKYMHRATVGRTVIGSTIKVINNGIECKPLEVGEIHAKTMTMFSGYTDINNAHAETQMIATGDLGYVDEENYLHFVGRADDVIISGGTNIYPEEIENIINECPGVEESAVIGLADDNRGEIVAAFIVGTPIVDPIQYCRDNLTPYKIPKKIFYVDSIPRNSTGKILRRSLFL